MLTSSEGEPHSLIVRVGSSFTVLVTVPVEAVEGLDPERERVFIASTVPAGEHVDQQLKLPAAA